MSKKTVWTFIIVILVVIILCPLLMQVVPYGRSHTNPPVVSEPKWDSPRTRELAQRACFDCHSNEIEYRQSIRGFCSGCEFSNSLRSRENGIIINKTPACVSTRGMATDEGGYKAIVA